LSRDEPFVIAVKSKPFVVVPYTFQLNDLQNFENRWRTCSDFAGELKAEFDVLYEESAHKRRMISVSAHDRVAGRAFAHAGDRGLHCLRPAPPRRGVFAEG